MSFFILIFYYSMVITITLIIYRVLLFALVSIWLLFFYNNFEQCVRKVHDLAIKFCSAVSPKSSQEIFFVFLFFKELNNCSTFSLKKKSIRKLICNLFLSKSSGTSAKIYEWKFYSVQMCKVPVLYYLQQLKYVERLLIGKNKK